MLTAVLGGALTGVPAPAQAAADTSNLFEMSIEELGKLRVTTASRRSEPLRRTTNAVYVITADEIRRSGLARLPEILRLAPGVEVARDGTYSWAISIRGFNSDLSNKLLVLIDGRSVYSPLYAGVFWDAQDVFVQDVERIEVIYGPGGTLWGSNAVNGVINIITRPAGDTQGTLIDVGAGTENRAFAGLRHGWEVSERIAARAYVEYAEYDESLTPSGERGVDDARTAQAGFRLDWEVGDRDRLTAQGDLYDSELGSMVRPPFTLGTLPGPHVPGTIDIGGFNVLGRWDRDLEDGGRTQLQVYFDHTSRDMPGTFNERRDTLDLDFHHDVARFGRHRFIWGGGVRVTSDDLDNTTFASFMPDERTDETFNLFAQDDISLAGDALVLTVGTKLEHNDYTGWEVQPNVRLGWTLDENQFLWAAVSRAVRIPARLNTDLELVAPIDAPAMPIPVYFYARGSDDFDSEKLLATEIGYRAGIGDGLSLDLTLFHHAYDELQTQELGTVMVVGTPPQYVLIPAMLSNGMQGDAYGSTVVVNWQPIDRWRLQFQYAHLAFDLELEPGSTDAGALSVAGNSPKHQAALYSSVSLSENFEIFTSIRYVDELPALGVPDRTPIDLSLRWRPLENLWTSLTVRNLDDDEHLEFGGANLVERSAWLRATWTF